MTNKSLIGEMNNFSELQTNQIFVSWKDNPGIGNYKLIAETLDKKNEKTVESVNVEIK